MQGCQVTCRDTKSYNADAMKEIYGTVPCRTPVHS